MTNSLIINQYIEFCKTQNADIDNNTLRFLVVRDYNKSDSPKTDSKYLLPTVGKIGSDENDLFLVAWHKCANSVREAQQHEVVNWLVSDGCPQNVAVKMFERQIDSGRIAFVSHTLGWSMNE